jgi:hypothetical protein
MVRNTTPRRVTSGETILTTSRTVSFRSKGRRSVCPVVEQIAQTKNNLTGALLVGFASAFFHIQHERGVAIPFMVSLGAFTVSLVDFAREVRIALSEFDHHG